MKILGLSFDYHDAAAALIIDGKIIAAETEERFTRRKHDQALPEQAIAFCLSEAGLSPSDLDRVMFYENTTLKLDRILRDAKKGSSHQQSLDPVIDKWVIQDKFFPLARIADHLGLPESRVNHVDHHASHAASAFFASPFREAVIVTLDGVGEYETASVSVGSKGRITKLYSQNVPHSLGLFYSALTAYLGFEVNEGEYKVMGMAGFGSPRYQTILAELFDLSPENGFRLDQASFDFSSISSCAYTQLLIDKLGPPRVPESDFSPLSEDENGQRSRHYADIAASTQAVAEQVILDYVQKACKASGLNRVCLAGGVALNSLANRRLEKELGIELFVQPAAGDAGGALGAAYLGEFSDKLVQAPPLSTALLGMHYDSEAIRPLIRRNLKRRTQEYNDWPSLLDAAAELIAQGQVIGWFQSRAEWGPRALGARSILANPTAPDMKDRVNRKVKFREPFRPFAPSVLTEKASLYFDVEESVPPAHPECFMLSIAPVRENYRLKLPAITHVDGTARLQRVHREANPLYYNLIEAVGIRTGIPMVLNTSFNLRGEPIVCTPQDALATFSFSDIDALVIDKMIIRK